MITVCWREEFTNPCGHKTFRYVTQVQCECEEIHIEGIISQVKCYDEKGELVFGEMEE
jgi:hypothetical protein